MDIQNVARNLNAVKTYGPLRVAQGETLRVISKLYKLTGTAKGNPFVSELDDRRKAIESSLKNSSTKKAGDAVPVIELERQRQEITRVYVTASGIAGYQHALEGVSLTEAVGHSIAAAPKLIGETIGATVAGVGDVAGGLVGGLLAGIGPILILIIIVVVMMNRTKK